MKLKVRGSACRRYRVSAVGPRQIAEDRKSVKRAVSKREVGVLMESRMLCVTNCE